jgi:hypothetical protein
MATSPGGGWARRECAMVGAVPSAPIHHLAVTRALVPSHAIVDAPEECEYYRRALQDMWGMRAAGARRTRAPGTNPVSLARADLPALRAKPHVVTLKSDGVRYALFLTVRPGSTRDPPRPVALMIDRAFHIFEVEVLATEQYFTEGTVLEGELVWRAPEERTNLFLIFDAVRVRGKSYLHRPFSERLEAARECTRWSEDLAALPPGDIEQRVLETDGIALVHFDPPVAMRPKRFVAREFAARVWAERADAEHRVDGLIIHRADARYVHGTATGATYKWKPQHTVDLAGPPDALRAAEGPLGTHIGARRVEVLPSRIECAGDDVAEYHVEVVDATTVRLFAMRRRVDKCHPNGHRVIAATVQDAVENLQPEQLCA